MAPKRKLKADANPEPSIFTAGSETFQGKRYFKDPKKISDHLICGICQDVFDEPWNLTCGHSFCRSCINDWLVNSPTCPIDRSRVDPQYCSKNIPVANIIGDLTIACPWRPYGCPNIDKYYIIKDHSTNKCSFDPNKMCPAMQAKMREIVVETPPSPAIKPESKLRSSKAPQGTSTLDELMAQLENGDTGLDDSVIEEDANTLPAFEVPSLATRLYVNSKDKRDILVDMMGIAPSKTKKTAGRPSTKKSLLT